MTRRAYDLDFYQRNKSAGLDWLSYGEWQSRYGRWLVGALQLREQRVLDVGCACGALTRALRIAGADAWGVDCSEDLVRLGRERWPDVAERLLVADAANLHLLDDATFDWVHTQAVAEHWRPELVPHIFRELRRVVRPGGHLFCSWDSAETFAAEGIRGDEEPTHICIRPEAWWRKQAEQAGWRFTSAQFERRLRQHNDSFLEMYPWSWFVAEREPQPVPGTGTPPAERAIRRCR